MHNPGMVEPLVARNIVRMALAMGTGACLMHRVTCVLLIGAGRSVHEVANWFGVGERSVQRWVHAFQSDGIDGLLQHLHHSGRPPSLIGEQAEAACRDLRSPPSVYGYREARWTGKRLARHLERRYGVKVSERTCQRMIARQRTTLRTALDGGRRAKAFGVPHESRAMLASIGAAKSREL